MKILIVNTLYAPNKIGGAEKSVQALAEMFTVLGHEVKVVCLDTKNIKYDINGVAVNALKIKNSYWPFDKKNHHPLQKFIWHLKDSKNTKYDNDFIQIINNFNPTILFTNNLSGFSTSIWSLAKRLNIKIVHTLRDYYLQCPKSTKFKNLKNCSSLCKDCSLLTLIKKKDSTKVDYLIGISNFILEDHQKNNYFKGVPYQKISNGFDTDTLSNKVLPKTNKVVFGYIGQVNKSKGIELLIKSFLYLKNNDWTLLIAGSVSEDYKTYLRTINKAKNIKFLGFVDSVTFYQKIDVLVVPSLWNEPFGRVALEAIINKKPIIASKVGGLKELLNNNKSFLFNPKEKELTTLVNKILLDDTFLPSFKFSKDFLEDYNLLKIAREYIKVFNKLLIDEDKIK